MAVFCQRCGTGLPVSARFCSNCGAVVPVATYIPGRPLSRPIVGRQIAGVCIGLAQAYGWDVALVRIFTVLGFSSPAGWWPWPIWPVGSVFPRSRSGCLKA